MMRLVYTNKLCAKRSGFSLLWMLCFRQHFSTLGLDDVSGATNTSISDTKLWCLLKQNENIISPI